MHENTPAARGVSALAIAVATGCTILMAGTATANDKLVELAKDPANWVMTGRDYNEQNYSEMTDINKENVKRLLHGHEGTPLVVGDRMYVHTPFPNTTFALDLNEPGKIIWQNKPKQNPTARTVACCDVVNRGLAYWPGDDQVKPLIFRTQLDGHIVAMDAETGETRWIMENSDIKVGSTLTIAPYVIKDMVLVGSSGAELGVRGYVTAYDVKTGEKKWRAFATGPDEELLLAEDFNAPNPHYGQKNLGTETWEGDAWKIGGGTTWGWTTYDPELNLIYYGTGNPSTWNPSQRPGDNRWSMTIMARDPDTGMAKWFYQKTPHDEWDFDGVNENLLVDKEIDGKMRKLLVNFDRNGFGYTLDRETGELLVAEKYDPAVNWATHVEMDPNSDQYGRPQVVAEYSTEQNGEDVNTTGVCPAALGSKDQQPSTYSPKTGLFYVPTNHVCMDYEPFRVSYAAGQPYVGATLSMFPAPDSHGGMGNFIAWDAVEGKIKWSLPEQFSVWSGAMATAGDIVFYGTLEGYLKAVDAETGKELYRFKTPSGIIGNVFTYEHGGKQYVGVLSGIGGWAGIGLAAGLTNANDGLGAVGGYAALSDYTALGGQLTMFKLPD